MEVIKPMDFSSFSAFCEHLDKSTKKVANSTTAVVTASTAAIVQSPTENDACGVKTTSATPPLASPHINGNADSNLQYFEKMERQGKLELAAKERENQRLQHIPKKWNRREEYEFLRVLTGYGVDQQPPTSLGLVLPPDWTKFKQMAHLERKSDETLSDYYKVFIAMCKRKGGVKLNDNERGLEGIIEEISEDHAKLILERLELLSKLREVARHPQLEERLKLCQMNADTPDWWEPGRHDKELISAVLKHGLYRSETFIFNDPNFSFAESEKRFIRELEAQIQRTIKLESFNADRLPSSVPVVKGEVIDLDDELLTKDSLIKKEQFIPSKTELKSEESVDGSDKVSVSTTELANKVCVVSAVESRKNNEKNDANADLSSSNQITELSAEGTKVDQAHELQDDDIKTLNTNTDDKSQENVSIEKADKVTSKQAVENISKDESENMDIEEATINKKDFNAITAVLDNENSNDMNESNDVGDGTTSTSPKASEPAGKTDDIEADKKDLYEKESFDEDDKPSCLLIETENNKQGSGDSVVPKENVINVDNVLTSNIDDSRSTMSKAEETISLNEGAVALTAEEKPKSAADEEILDLAVAATVVTDLDSKDVVKEKEKSVEEECKKQAAELKARFPDLEVIQPSTAKQKQDRPKLEMCIIRWFKDFALERRISHIVICVETNKWPVNKNYTAFAGCKGIDLNICLHEAIPHLKNFERPPSTTDVITITTEQSVTKHLQPSNMPIVAPSSTPQVPITTLPAVVGNIGMPHLTPPANVAGSSDTGKAIVNVTTPDSNSVNISLATAVTATASGGNNTSALPTGTLSSLLPGMTMTPSSTAVTAALTNSPVVPLKPNISNSVPTPLTPNTQTTGKKRKRHIAIDVETERAKLHALLNSSQNMGLKDWETEIANMEPPVASQQSSGRRSVSSASPVAPTVSATNMPLQPPPAHQHASLARQTSGQFSKPAIPPIKTPPTSIGAPMDLSSSLPRVNMTDMLKSASGAIDLSEVHDFSMSSKKTPSHLHASLNSAFPAMGGKGKLDDTLNKLMKKNNCTIEEPVIGKEKKRKKLDEIVLGLSAAKEQRTFPDPSLPSSKKPQIPPSVSVTPASLQTSVSNTTQQVQKPFTITVTTVPGKSKSGGNTSMPSPAPVTSSLSSGLPLMSGGLSLKDINAIVAQTMASDPQTLFKQQQKMMQCLPPAQRKAYEAMLAEMEQAMKLSAKYNVPDLKVNKWLTDMSTPLSDQLNMDFNSAAASTSSNTNSRRSNRQQTSNSAHPSSISQINKGVAGQSAQQAHVHHQQQQQQPAIAGPQGLTGEEPVPVVNKQTGKRISGSKAPQLKRLMQWLTENPAYEVDPKWLEQIQNPMSIPSPKLSSMDTSNYASTSKSTHGGRPSSTSSSSSSGAHTQQQQSSSTQSSPAPSPTVSSKKSSRQSAIDQANAAMQFGSLAGLNPSLLASLPSLGAFDPKNPLGAFDPKNPLLSMPFAGMPGMSNIPGLNNLNSMNLFASLAGMGGLGNLATMDPQTLAALMAAGSALAGLGSTNAGPANSSTGKNSQSAGSSGKKNKNDAQQNAMNLGALSSNTGNSGSNSSGTGNSSNKNASAAAASQLTGCFPYLFPNPSLLYPPMGLGGLNPYSLGSPGLGSAYDQLAQQYNLLNGGTGVTSSAGSSSTTQSKSQSKSSNSRASTSSSSSAASVANLMNVMASMGAAGQAPTSVSSSQSSSRSTARQSAASRAAAQAAEMAQLSSLLLPGTDPHLLESLSRMDLAQSTRLLSSLGISPITAPAPQSSSGDKRSSNSNSAASIAAAQAAQAEKQAAKEQQKWMESLARSQLPTDLVTLQAFSQGKFPASLSGGIQSTSSSSSASTSSASSNKNASKAAAAALAAQLPQILGLPSDFAPAMIADMAQALTAPGSLASLAGLTMPPSSSASTVGSGSGSSSSSSKRQRGGAGGGSGGSNSTNILDPDALAKDAFKQQMEYYTKTLGLGSGISLIPTSSMSSSAASNSISNVQIDEHHKSKRSRLDSHAAALANAKDELSAAMLASGLPLNLGGGMTSIEKSLRGVNVGMSASGGTTMPEADKVTLTPLNSAGIAANLPSQTTITIAPPISSGASSSSERSERSESRISLTITNAADAAKLPPPYEEADELIIQPILKKPQNIPTSTAPSVASSSHGSLEDLEAAVAVSMGGNTSSGNTTPTPSTSAAAAVAAAASANEEHRRSSSRLKRPRTGTDHFVNEQPPEKRRELRSTRHTRQSSGSLEATLIMSTNSEAEEKNE